MIDEETYKAYASALEANADLVNNAIIALERELGSLTGSALEQALAALYSAIVKEYGQIAAQAAIEFYVSVRAAANVEQEYVPVASQSKSVKTLSKDVSEVMGADSVLADKLKNLGGYGIRRTMEQASDTIIDNAYLDHARPCWAIVPRVGACGWCILLGSQGFVYRSNTTADSARHKWCKCVTVVDFDTKNPHLKGYDTDGLYKRYKSCRDAIEEDAHHQWYNVMSDEEKAKYGNKRRSDYDHYLRNRIVSEINKRDKDWTLTGKIPSITKDSKANPLPKEKTIAQTLANNGFSVHFRETRSVQNKRTSDVLIGGVSYEIKQPTGGGKQTIYHQFENAIGQSKRLVLDTSIVTKQGGIWDSNTVEKAVRKYVNWHYQDNGKTVQFEDVLLVDGNDIKRVSRYIKKES